MKRNFLKRLSSLALALSLTTTLFTGCGGAAATDETASAGADGQVEQNTQADGADAPYAFTVTTVRWADWGTDFLKGFIEESEAIAGVDAEWQIYEWADWTDQKSLLLASGDIPDVFFGSICLTDADIAQNLSTFVPLEDLIAENMPNLSAAFEAEPALKAMATAADGHIYSLPRKLPCRPQSWDQPFINQTWLDNLGISMPTTYEEFYNVLKAFKEQDANGNGDPDDEIPFSGVADVMRFLTPFGTTASNGGYNITLKDGEAVYIPMTQMYKDGLIWMRKAYEEGLIDPEYFTQDSNMANAKMQNPDIALVGTGYGWTADAVFGVNANQYAVVPALMGPDGQSYTQTDTARLNYGRNELLITQTCENPAAVLQWADQFYTSDASIQTFYGSFGTAVEKNEDGTYTVLTPPEGESADLFAWTNSVRDFGPKYVPEGFTDLVALPEGNGDGIKLKIDSAGLPGIHEQYPLVTYTTEQAASLTTMYTDLSLYVNTMTAQWVVEGGIEEGWDAYIEQLKAMGADEFVKIHKDAYEAYKAAK